MQGTESRQEAAPRAALYYLAQWELSVGPQEAPKPFTTSRRQRTSVRRECSDKPKGLVASRARRPSRPDVRELNSAQ
eukprot:12725927-Alexandrium_andersonii.AAC.1